MNMIKQSVCDGGSGISKSAILRALIRLLQQLDVDVAGVCTEDQLLERLKNSIQDPSNIPIATHHYSDDKSII
jgi:hypothetical protein